MNRCLGGWPHPGIGRIATHRLSSESVVQLPELPQFYSWARMKTFRSLVLPRAEVRIALKVFAGLGGYGPLDDKAHFGADAASDLA